MNFFFLLASVFSSSSSFPSIYSLRSMIVWYRFYERILFFSDLVVNVVDKNRDPLNLSEYAIICMSVRCTVFSMYSYVHVLISFQLCVCSLFFLLNIVIFIRNLLPLFFCVRWHSIHSPFQLYC